MPVMPFSSAAEIVNFAKAFLREHEDRFRKDIKICLTADENNRHAYFPALITCVAFADFLSGLYAGKLDGHGLEELKKYATKFMSVSDYTTDRLEILYECFRNKVAHVAQPYAIFDTHSKRKFRTQRRRLITWTVQASRRKPPIEIIPTKGARQVLTAVTPWPVYYDHRVFVSLRTLAGDIRKTIPKYLRHLKNEEHARRHFKNCMAVYFSQ
jgi:hypothetical protein